ncbi:protein-arginine deiminase family protein [Streptomyces sp. NPDC048581]|uniref:protein-arginine deiminase family protein n=1 Tax=Streptomyces sp. NPDC048581 TaxID=3365572 RepID=UPI00371A06D7
MFSIPRSYADGQPSGRRLPPRCRQRSRTDPHHLPRPQAVGPGVGGKDILAEAVTKAYAKVGMRVRYLDDWRTQVPGRRTGPPCGAPRRHRIRFSGRFSIEVLVCWGLLVGIAVAGTRLK